MGIMGSADDDARLCMQGSGEISNSWCWHWAQADGYSHQRPLNLPLKQIQTCSLKSGCPYRSEHCCCCLPFPSTRPAAQPSFKHEIRRYVALSHLATNTISSKVLTFHSVLLKSLSGNFYNINYNEIAATTSQGIYRWLYIMGSNHDAPHVPLPTPPLPNRHTRVGEQAHPATNLSSIFVKAQPIQANPGLLNFLQIF